MPEHLTRLHAVRAGARERAWAAGAGPDLSAGLVIDIDATITIAHSEKENAAKTWKKTFGFHPLLAYLDRPDVAGGRWPGSCDQAKPDRTPPPTTPGSSRWRCPRYQPTPGRAQVILSRRR